MVGGGNQKSGEILRRSPVLRPELRHQQSQVVLQRNTRQKHRHRRHGVHAGSGGSGTGEKEAGEYVRGGNYMQATEPILGPRWNNHPRYLGSRSFAQFHFGRIVNGFPEPGGPRFAANIGPQSPSPNCTRLFVISLNVSASLEVKTHASR